MPYKTFKYRLYPNKDQVEKLERTLDKCRELYNAALQERRDTWNIIKQHPNFYDHEIRKELARQHSISKFSQSREFTEVKRDVRPEYQEIGDHVSRDVLNRVDKAFDAFFRRVKAGQTPGYPRFQGKARYDSFCFPDYRGWKLEGKQLILSKIGEIKVKLHRDILGTIKTVTIKREGTHWYAMFVCEVVQDLQYHPSEGIVGIDLGLLHFATLSNGDTIENPRYYRRSEKKLKKAQEALSRKKRKDDRTGCKGNRRKKAVQQVAKCHRKVRNQRKDFLHKASRKLVQMYGTVVFEDLSTKNLVRRPKPKLDTETGQFLPNGASSKAGLNKSITDAGWGMFVQYCQHKAEEAGATVLLVDPRKTSQICSGCGVEGEHKDLLERTHTCAHCGIVLDRDHNAAINIRTLGLRQREARVLGT